MDPALRARLQSMSGKPRSFQRTGQSHRCGTVPGREALRARDQLPHSPALEDIEFLSFYDLVRLVCTPWAPSMAEKSSSADCGH